MQDRTRVSAGPLLPPLRRLLLVLAAYVVCLVQAGVSLKIYAAGAGNVVNLPESAKEILELSNVRHRLPHVLYIGTASYDDASSKHIQTSQFVELGCNVTTLDVAWSTPGSDAIHSSFADADIIIVSGGNTLFAVDRWAKLGIDVHIKRAAHRDVVLAGGSAGAIVWFDAGHSDSMDPTTYKNPPGPIYSDSLGDDDLQRAWAYLRVPGLQLLPGLLCPHYDATGSNGMLRSESFTNTLRHHSGEVGVTLDNFAALMIDGDDYELVSRGGRTGSVAPDGSFVGPDFAKGKPGGWMVRIQSSDGSMNRTLIPSHGKVLDLLEPARYVAESEMLPVARLMNPDDGVAPRLVNASAFRL